jgi:hypothetical protein
VEVFGRSSEPRAQGPSIVLKDRRGSGEYGAKASLRMPLLLRAASVLLAVMLTCAFAQAEGPAELVPPVVENSTDVPYPAGGAGDAQVVLELTIERDGTVSSAVVVDGVEPFAEQARVAALGWHFQPARRGDAPVRARITARVAFHQETEEEATPAAVPTPAPAATAGAAARPPAAPKPEPSVEIMVVGERHEIGQTTLSKHDVREMPGAFGDAFRTIEALPGVAPVVSGIPYFYVRGAPPNNAGYFVDGVRVPLLFHLGVGQSVVHPGLIDHVDFFPSVAPVKYGGYAGPIIAGQTREPATRLRGEANLRLVDAGALVEAPFADGRGAALVAGRYGYPGAMLRLFTDEIQIGYWDYQARASWKLGPRDTIGVFAFGSHDYLASRSPSGDPEARKNLQEELVSDFHRLDLRYDHLTTDGRVRLAVTGGYDSQGAEPTYAKNRLLGARFELEQKLADTLRVRGGLNAELDLYRMRITAQGPREPVIPQSSNPPPTNFQAGVYADLIWRLTPRLELVPGVRFGLFGSRRSREAPSTGKERWLLPAVDPRVSLRVTIAPGAAWLASFGVAHQYPALRLGNVPAPMATVPGFPFGDRELQRSTQGSQGFELALPGDVTWTATGFYTLSWGLTDLSASCYQLEPESRPPPMGEEIIVPPFVCPNNRPVSARAYGVELMLRRPFTKRLGGLVSYTLSRATREGHFLRPDGGEDVEIVPSEFDRTHVLNAVLGYQLGRGWRVGGRLLFYTGTPYSQRSGSLAVPPYHAYRNPAFYRLDFRLEKRWQLSQTGSIAFVLEGQNVTLQTETTALGLDCEGERTPQGETNTCKQSKVGPLTIPSVGVEAFF